MNKLILGLSLTLIGCASVQNIQPTRQVLNCQAEPIISKQALFVGGSKVKDTIDCYTVQVPVVSKAQPLSVDPRLIDKNQN